MRAQRAGSSGDRPGVEGAAADQRPATTGIVTPEACFDER